MARHSGFPYNAWDLMNQGTDAQVEIMGPMYQQQGLASALAQNLQRQGGAENNMFAQQMQANPQAGMGAMEILDNRATQQAANTANYGSASLNRAKAADTGMMTSLIESAVSGGGGVAGPQVATGADLETLFALRGGKSADIFKAQQNQKYGGLSAASLDKTREGYEKRLLPLDVSDKAYRLVEGLNMKKPLDIYQLAQAWQQVADPGAVVRESDIQMIMKATGAGHEAVMALLEGFFDLDASIPPEMGRILKKSYLRMLAADEDALLQIADTQDETATFRNYTKAARIRSTAFPSVVKRARARQKARRESQVPKLKESDITSLPAGSVRTFTDENGVEQTITKNSDGTWGYEE